MARPRALCWSRVSTRDEGEQGFRFYMFSISADAFTGRAVVVSLSRHTGAGMGNLLCRVG